MPPNLPQLAQLVLLLLIIATPARVRGADPAPDIRSVPSDLTVPQITSGPPSAGRRCLITDPESTVDFVVWLPHDWTPNRDWPVIIELPGNGGYRGPYGDTCSGLPEDCCLGYGITEGVGAIWICVPFLSADGSSIAVTWWGDPPTFDPRPTVRLLQRVIEWTRGDPICGDSERIILAGFSRGSLACNRLGLLDDRIASAWRGMICFSHYDGVREAWPYVDSDQKSAVTRLERLGTTPQFICHESDARPAVSLAATQSFLQEFCPDGAFTFCETGFRNHSDQWVLRPSAARDRLRVWYRNLLEHPVD